MTPATAIEPRHSSGQRSREAEAAALEFSPSLLRLQDSPPAPLGRSVLYSLLALLAALLAWATWGQLDIVAVAQGKLVPESFLKIVQPAEAGIVHQILVKEGETVHEGQVLMRMDSVASEADGKTLELDRRRKAMTLRRLDAEIGEREFSAIADDSAALFRELLAQFRANRAALESALGAERANLQKARQDLATAMQVSAKLSEILPHYRAQDEAFENLVKDGFAGAIMGSEKRRDRIEKEQELKTQRHVIESARAAITLSETRLLQIRSDNRRQLHAERHEVEAQLEKLSQDLGKQAHRQELLELKAPQTGTVKDLATHTVGTVVQPGTVLLTVVPDGERLKAEVWVDNQDIGFIRPGQIVRLKLAAFPFQRYGMIDGTIEHVGADSSESAAAPGGIDRRGARDPVSMPLAYKALVSLRSMVIDHAGGQLALAPGMQTNAEILLGRRTVLEFLLSPVQQAFHEAARER
ncbi:MAG: HlyD family type I secretion periplasmic adaptor subunit [Caldimonas sp.]